MEIWNYVPEGETREVFRTADNKYPCVIERGHSPINDRIIDFLKGKIEGKWLDIGCNTGWLLSEVPNGIGIDASREMVLKALDKGLVVTHGWGQLIPYGDKFFDTVVLSCVLEQCEDWKSVLEEAVRVGKKVIGINPYPGRSTWGKVGGWVKSIIFPEEMNAYIEPLDEERYYFEILGE